jgi:hypothetical protein
MLADNECWGAKGWFRTVMSLCTVPLKTGLEQEGGDIDALRAVIADGSTVRVTVA